MLLYINSCHISVKTNVYLDSSFTQICSFCQFFPNEGIWVVGTLKNLGNKKYSLSSQVSISLIQGVQGELRLILDTKWSSMDHTIRSNKSILIHGGVMEPKTALNRSFTYHKQWLVSAVKSCWNILWVELCKFFLPQIHHYHLCREILIYWNNFRHGNPKMTL